MFCFFIPENIAEINSRLLSNNKMKIFKHQILILSLIGIARGHKITDEMKKKLLVKNLNFFPQASLIEPLDMGIIAFITVIRPFLTVYRVITF